MSGNVNVEGRTPDSGNSATPYTLLKETTAKDIPWYQSTVGPRLKSNMRQLFEDYSGIASEEVIPHIEKVRDNGWSTRPYPCVGSYGFLATPSVDPPALGTLVSRLQKGDTFVDLGACFGQELRILAAAGAPTTNMYAVDLISDFWDLSYELFRDQERMKAKFIKANFLLDESRLKSLDGKMDIIHAGYFFHLFGWDDQIKALLRVVKLSRPGTMLIGHQIGRETAQEVTASWGGGQKLFYHNAESWVKIWNEVQKISGTNWVVGCKCIDLAEFGLETEDFSWMAANATALKFTVTRL